MITLTETQQGIVDNTAPGRKWLFTVTPTAAIDGTAVFYWSLAAFTFDEQAYTSTIIPESFGGVKETRARSEHGIQAPDETSFEIVFDYDHADDFVGASVRLDLVMSDDENEEIIRTYKFVVKRCDPEYGKLRFTCVDFVQKYIDGYYPNTPLVKDLFPSADGLDDNLCVPVPFGTAYVPLRSVYISGDGRYYVLGPASGKTYTISAVHTPSNGWASNSEWDDSYTFTQASKTDRDSVDWRVFSPIIIDADNDGTLDSAGLFNSNGTILDVPTEFYEAATQTTTSPADIIAAVLEDFGIDSGDIDTGVGSTFATAATTFASWGLTWNGAFYTKETRRTVLSRLLNMCHSTLRVTDKIELHVLSKASQKTITKSSVVRKADKGFGSFKTSAITQTVSDSAYVSYTESGKPQDVLVKVKTPVKASTSSPSNETLEFPFVQTSGYAQKLGTLCIQRKYLQEKKESFSAKPNLVALQPNDFITLNDPYYGGSHVVLIDEMKINNDGSIDFICIKFSDAIDDWVDLTPDTIVTAVDDSSNLWTQVYAGPDSTVSGGVVPNVLPGRLWIGEGAILLDGPNKAISINDATFGNEGLQVEYNAGSPQVYIGDGADEFFRYRYVDEIPKLSWKAENTELDENGNLICSSGLIGGFTISGTDGLYAGAAATRVQMKAGSGFWAGATAFGDAPFSVDQSGALKSTSADIGGWSVDATKISITGLELDSDNNRFRAYTDDNYIDLTAAGLTGYDSVLGTTFKIPTNGDAPEFSSGVIKESEYQIYTSGVIKTAATPATSGGLLINNTKLIAYDDTPTKFLEFIYSGTDKGDVYIGDYDNDNSGLKYDHSAGTLNYRGDVSIDSGGDISLVGSDTDPGKIHFVGSSYECNLGLNAAGTALSLIPDDDNEIDLYLGSAQGLYWHGANRFDSIYMDAVYNLRERLYYSHSFNTEVTHDYNPTAGATKITMRANSLTTTLSAQTWVQVYSNGDTSEEIVTINGQELTPYADNATDIGTSSRAWKDIYYYTAYDQCHVYDDLDDIGILTGSYVPLLDEKGQTVTDEYGHAKLDLARLPDFLTNKKKLAADLSKRSGTEINVDTLNAILEGAEPIVLKVQEESECKEITLNKKEAYRRLYRDQGKVLDIAIGAIKKLTARVEALESA
ncbi:MAG: hypothetical protein JXM72_12795 [Deltaproteobacteria bacterium]|nr:hypothetical protein [Deltaproteobacteria bacterium]